MFPLLGQSVPMDRRLCLRRPMGPEQAPADGARTTSVNCQLVGAGAGDLAVVEHEVLAEQRAVAVTMLEVLVGILLLHALVIELREVNVTSKTPPGAYRMSSA